RKGVEAATGGQANFGSVRHLDTGTGNKRTGQGPPCQNSLVSSGLESAHTRPRGIPFCLTAAGPRGKNPSTFVPNLCKVILNPSSYCRFGGLRLHSLQFRGGSVLSATERRSTQRFTMRLPLTVRWTTGAAVGETSTESRDVSSRGVYFYLG